jgi:hypothetical protein
MNERANDSGLLYRPASVRRPTGYRVLCATSVIT